MEWRKAMRLARELKRTPYNPSVSYELVLCLDGGDFERMFQDFLAEPGARDMITEQPDLITLLADRKALAAMDEGSLGRTYLALTQEDGYTADGLADVQDQTPGFKEIAPDPIRRWLYKRNAALHDVAHAFTGYGRDRAGEAALNVFTSAIYPHRIVRFYSLVGALVAPRDRYFRNLSYMHETWLRGRRARIPLSARWEQLLPLQLKEVCRRLEVQTVDDAHPSGIMREATVGGPWVSTRDVQGNA
ncbi:Coq4 family protein [Sorangium sp. So ce362]|uniref:Coq4 family protein n=1 Tax=Sorangium sp. So ce362 TaxID=3133303 RepID=UPI003F5DE522